MTKQHQKYLLRGLVFVAGFMAVAYASLYVLNADKLARSNAFAASCARPSPTECLFWLFARRMSEAKYGLEFRR